MCEINSIDCRAFNCQIKDKKGDIVALRSVALGPFPHGNIVAILVPGFTEQSGNKDV